MEFLFGDVNDLILVMNSSARLHVSSIHLINASSTFKAMLTGCFAESQKSVQPKEIELPDDDPDSMEILMDVIHLNNHAVPTELHCQQLLKVAKLADKYDCTTSFKFVSYTWFHERVTSPFSLDEHFTLLATAYLLNDHRAFRFHTRPLVMDHVLTVAELLDRIDAEAIPEKKRIQLALAVEKRRVDTLKTLESEMETLANDMCIRTPDMVSFLPAGCTVPGFTISQIKLFLHETFHPEAFIGSARAVLRELLSQLRLYKVSDGSTRSFHTHRSTKDTQQALFAALDRTEKVADGVCLICLRGGYKDIGNCIEHLGSLGDQVQHTLEIRE